jgi:hypothetical protein
MQDKNVPVKPQKTVIKVQTPIVKPMPGETATLMRIQDSVEKPKKKN